MRVWRSTFLWYDRILREVKKALLLAFVCIAASLESRWDCEDRMCLLMLITVINFLLFKSIEIQQKEQMFTDRTRLQITRVRHYYSSQDLVSTLCIGTIRCLFASKNSVADNASNQMVEFSKVVTVVKLLVVLFSPTPIGKVMSVVYFLLKIIPIVSALYLVQFKSCPEKS